LLLIVKVPLLSKLIFIKVEFVSPHFTTILTEFDEIVIAGFVSIAVANVILLSFYKAKKNDENLSYILQIFKNVLDYERQK